MLTIYRRGKPYTPERFRDEAQPPIFYLRPLPQDMITDFAGAVAASDQDVGKVAKDGTQALYASLCGWKNVVDEDGAAVPFDPEKVREMVDQLDAPVRLDLIGQITRLSFLDEADRKNSASASSSGAATSRDTTAPSAGSQETKASESEPGKDASSP